MQLFLKAKSDCKEMAAYSLATVDFSLKIARIKLALLTIPGIRLKHGRTFWRLFICLRKLKNQNWAEISEDRVKMAKIITIEY